MQTKGIENFLWISVANRLAVSRDPRRRLSRLLKRLIASGDDPTFADVRSPRPK